MGKGQPFGAVFIDLSQALHIMRHSKVLTKLPSYGIEGKELTWFEDCIFDQKA